MIEAVMFWNEPNNKSHWDFEIDKDWNIFSRMIADASMKVKEENPNLTRVLGGISPIDPFFIKNLRDKGALKNIDVIAVHGFPLDWNHWQIYEWPDKIKEIEDMTSLPIWISEVGTSSFGAEEVQEFGLLKTYELISKRVDRIHWYSLFDLPKAWPATTRHREAEGSSYYRHFYMGLLKEDGTPKRAFRQFKKLTDTFGICQWFHFKDHRLNQAVSILKELDVKYLRTGLSWADYLRPNSLEWFDEQMEALESFETTLTFCFTPESKGIIPHYTSPPQDIGEFSSFCTEMVKRYSSTGKIKLENRVY